MRLRNGVVALVLFTLILGSTTRAFAGEDPAKSATQNSSGERDDPQFPSERKSPEEIKREQEMAKARQKERFQQIQKDTDKLLQLATELKQYVDKSKESILSIEVIRKADEIEKLSRSVRDKMKGE